MAMSLAALASVFAKLLTDEFEVIQVLWFRLVLGCIFLIPLFISACGKRLPGFGKLHFLRAFLLVGMTGLWFYALQLGPISRAAAFSYTYPVLILIFSAIFFGERIQKLDILSVIVSFAGVAVVFQKGWSSEPFGPVDILQIAAVFGSCVFIATRVTVEKIMTAETPSEDILLGSMIIAAVLLLPFVVLDWKSPNLIQFWWLVGLATSATLSQLFVIQLVRKNAWKVVSVFAFWEVPATILFGILIFSESVSMFGIIGTALILAGGLIQIRRE